MPFWFCRETHANSPPPPIRPFGPQIKVSASPIIITLCNQKQIRLSDYSLYVRAMSVCFVCFPGGKFLTHGHTFHRKCARLPLLRVNLCMDPHEDPSFRWGDIALFVTVYDLVLKNAVYHGNTYMLLCGGSLKVCSKLSHGLKELSYNKPEISIQVSSF